MISGEALLLDIAKIAISVTGFTGVVLAFRNPRDAPWKANEVAGLKMLIEHSLGAVFFGLVPALAYLHWADEAVVYKICSAMLAVFLVAEVLLNIYRIQSATAKGHPPRYLKLLLFQYFLCTLLALYWQVQNVLDWHTSAAYAGGCFWLLLTGCQQFGMFLLRVPREPTS